MINLLFYSVVYDITHAGNKKDPQVILFASPYEVDNDQIKEYILKKLKLHNAAINLRSANKLRKETFMAVGGNPHQSFK